jgi:hypothetical protein
VLHLARIARVGGFVQRGLDGEVAHAVAGGGAAEARVAFEQANAVARLRQKRARREPAKA